MGSCGTEKKFNGRLCKKDVPKIFQQVHKGAINQIRRLVYGRRKRIQYAIQIERTAWTKFQWYVQLRSKDTAATQKEIQSLNKLQSDISSYVKQQQSVDALKNKLSVYQQQLQNIQTELKASGEYNSALANKELELKQRIEQTEAAINQKSQTVSNTYRKSVDNF